MAAEDAADGLPTQRPPLSSWGESLLIAGSTLVAYLLLLQRTLYGVDGWRLLRRIDAEDYGDNLHLLYKPLAITAKRVGEGLFGLSTYESTVVLSALGVSLGALFWHRAFLTLGLGRLRAVVAALLCAVSPGPVFFATVVELHGPFLAFAGLATWVGAGLVRQPSLLRAVATGLAISVAYAAHSSGLFLVPGVILPFLAEGRRLGVSWFQVGRTLALVGGSAALLSVAWRLLAHDIGTLKDPGASFEFFRLYAGAHVAKPQLIPFALWNELIVPFLPVVVTAFAVARGWTLTGLSIAGGVYLVINWLLLGDFDERGAYSLPFVFPVVWVVVARLRLAAVGVLLVLAATVSCALVADHDRRPTAPQAEALRSFAGPEQEPFLLVAGIDDFALRFIEFPGLERNQDFLDLLDLCALPPEQVTESLPLLAGVVTTLAGERPVILLDPSLSRMEREYAVGETERRESGPLLLAELRRRFRFVRIDDERLEGHSLEPR